MPQMPQMPRTSSKRMLNSSSRNLSKAQFLYEARYFPKRTAEKLERGEYIVPESVYQGLNYIQVLFVMSYARKYKLPCVFDGVKNYSGNVPDALVN